jgi:hypothetical protein
MAQTLHKGVEYIKRPLNMCKAYGHTVPGEERPRAFIAYPLEPYPYSGDSLFKLKTSDGREFTVKASELYFDV